MTTMMIDDEPVFAVLDPQHYEGQFETMRLSTGIDLSKEPDVLRRIDESKKSSGRRKEEEVLLGSITSNYRVAGRKEGNGDDGGDQTNNAHKVILTAVAVCDRVPVVDGTTHKWENCSSYARYDDRTCASAALCPVDAGFRGFSVDCSGISESYPSCQLRCDDGLITSCYDDDDDDTSPQQQQQQQNSQSQALPQSHHQQQQDSQQPQPQQQESQQQQQQPQQLQQSQPESEDSQQLQQPAKQQQQEEQPQQQQQQRAKQKQQPGSAPSLSGVIDSSQAKKSSMVSTDDPSHQSGAYSGFGVGGCSATNFIVAATALLATPAAAAVVFVTV